MTQNTGRAQCARIPDPCNKVAPSRTACRRGLATTQKIIAASSRRTLTLQFSSSRCVARRERRRARPMTLLPAWFLAGFLIGIITGTLATDLSREDFLEETELFKTIKIWKWSRKQLLFSFIWLWFALLSVALCALYWNETEWWKNLLLGTLAGSATAPWVWLHFVRRFGDTELQDETRRENLTRVLAHQIWIAEGMPADRADEHWHKAQ